MAAREALGGLVALLLGVSALTACERSTASSGAPSPTVAASATTPESTSEATTVTAPAPASPAGSTTEQTHAADTGGTSGGADTGTDSNNGNGSGAVGSPIDVPTIPDPHASMDGLRPEIERDFVKACGGDTLCVHLVYTQGACFIGYSPSATAPRGSTVTVLTESQQDCDAANGVAPEPTDEPTSEPTSEQPSDGASTGASSGASTGASTGGSTGASNGASTATSSAGAGAGP